MKYKVGDILKATDRKESYLDFEIVGISRDDYYDIEWLDDRRKTQLIYKHVEDSKEFRLLSKLERVLT